MVEPGAVGELVEDGPGAVVLQADPRPGLGLIAVFEPAVGIGDGDPVDLLDRAVVTGG